MTRPLLLAMGAVALLTLPAYAQTTASSAPATAQDIQPLQVTDPQEFATKATIGNLFEIQSSQLALQQASDATVKQFAQQMVADHTQASQQMQAAVQAQGSLTVPTGLDQPHTDMLSQLQAAQGADFDRLYVKMQTQAHIEAVGLFSGFASAGTAGPLKDFAAATLPTLQHHYEMVKGLPQSQQQ